MEITKSYPTKAEIKHLEEIRKRFNLKDDSLTGHIPKNPYTSREFKQRDNKA